MQVHQGLKNNFNMNSSKLYTGKQKYSAYIFKCCEVFLNCQPCSKAKKTARIEECRQGYAMLMAQTSSTISIINMSMIQKTTRHIELQAVTVPSIEMKSVPKLCLHSMQSAKSQARVLSKHEPHIKHFISYYFEEYFMISKAAKTKAIT